MPSRLILISLFILEALADPTDFVNPDYVLKHSNDPHTSAARASIEQNAQSAARNGPWTLINTHGEMAPSGDKHDCLSWAPYHWPDCHWCTSGRTHLVHSGDGGNGTDSEPEDPSSDQDLGPGEDTGDDDSSEDNDYTRRSGHEDHLHLAARHNRMLRLRRNFSTSTVSSTSTTSAPSPDLILDELPLPQAPFYTSLPSDSLPTPAPHTTSQHIAGSSSAPQAAVKTKSSSKSTCTPSPTKSLAPSATWTTCPYEPRDGQVNPDVRTLACAGAINKVSDGCLSNALSFVFFNLEQYAKASITLINAFFLNEETYMNPNMNYGQVVRGPRPENQIGTFTGPLDMRGLVKVVNAILILKKSNSQDWTSKIDQSMVTWMTQYLSWLQTSDIGKKACLRPNNHGTFCHLSIAALCIALNKIEEAIKTLDTYYKTTYQEQIAKSGEQPFEAIRTRPFHYRCFNLEGMIAMAKIGDYLGRNDWVQRTEQGATMQNAVEFLIKTDPGKEEEAESELLPHVAAAMAAYGPSTAYANFLDKHNYQREPFWFYDQPSALLNAPTSKSEKRSTVVWRREDGDGDEDSGSGVAGALDPTCPLKAFAKEKRVEIDNGIWCNCTQLLPFFGLL